MSMLRPTTVLSVSLFALLFLRVASPGQSELAEPFPEFPPGATVVFPESQRLPEKSSPVGRVFIKRNDSKDPTVWIVPEQHVSLGLSGNNTTVTGSTSFEAAIGFVVPQLQRGSYEAWYESPHPSFAIPSVKFTIVPHLLAEDGLIRTVPGKEVEVRVRIPVPKVSRKEGSDLEKVNVLASLESQDPDVAEVLPVHTLRISTDGLAIWRVRINHAGVTELKASAENFEPAVLNVVGMPGPGATFLEAERDVLIEHAESLERAAATATERTAELSSQVEARQRQATARVMETSRARAESKSEASKEARREFEKATRELEANDEAAKQEAARYLKEATEARAAADQLTGSLPGLQPRTITDNELKPGDILLVLGNSPILSDAIRFFEGEQMGGQAQYSHASLYLGEMNGKRMVAEMWSSGYWITPLKVSTKGARLVDVYRWSGISDAKRSEIATRAANIFGNPTRFIKNEDPTFSSSGSPLPYAYEEISLLGLTGLGTPDLGLTRFVTGFVDPRAGGRRKMICSELVAWVYHDSGLDMDVPYWRKLIDARIFTTDDRKRDYTTPNMIARSRNLSLVGRYLGP